MMSYVPERLAGLFCNLAEAVTFEEVKFESLSLVWRKLFSNPVKQRSGDNLIDEQRLALSLDLFLVNLLSVVVLPKCEVLPAIDGPMVGDLDNPGRRRPFARVEKFRFLKQQKEDLLAEVFGLGCVSQYS
jgi:hypothetical protein